LKSGGYGLGRHDMLDITGDSIRTLREDTIAVNRSAMGPEPDIWTIELGTPAEIES
jgi:hypothetical protein